MNKDNQNLSEFEKKKERMPIWNHFTLCEKNSARAVCQKCGESKSLGSDIPKKQTTANLKNHLKTKHLDQYNKFLKSEQDLKNKKRPRNEEVFYNLPSIFVSFLHILQYDISGYMIEISQKKR